jgi:hypothetical protein
MPVYSGIHNLWHKGKGGGEGGNLILLQGSQASSACPSFKGSVNVETLGWIEAGVFRQGPRDSDFLN